MVSRRCLRLFVVAMGESGLCRMRSSSQDRERVTANVMARKRDRKYESVRVSGLAFGRRGATAETITVAIACTDRYTVI